MESQEDVEVAFFNLPCDRCGRKILVAINVASLPSHERVEGLDIRAVCLGCAQTAPNPSWYTEILSRRNSGD